MSDNFKKNTAKSHCCADMLRIVSIVKKKGSKQLSDYYRPISLTDKYVLWIARTYLHFLIRDHLELENILMDVQYGFHAHKPILWDPIGVHYT